MISNKQRALAEHQHFDYSEHIDENDLLVIDYLRSSPDFFSRNPQLLMEIEVPHYERGAVSLIEKRLALHREQFDDLKKRLNDIVDVAHRNDYLTDLLHDYSMSLISAESISDVLKITRRTLDNNLSCNESKTVITSNDVIELCLDDEVDSVILAEAGDYESLAKIHTRKNVYCGPLSRARREQLFPDTDTDIQSVAIIKLVHSSDHSVSEIGYLALASDDKDRFAPHMGTDFLGRFGELLSARLSVFYS